MSTYVSIGRNTPDGRELSHEEWLAFALAVREAVDTWAGPIVTSAWGRGSWERPEDTYVVVGAYTDGRRSPTEDKHRRNNLDAALRLLVKIYRQECIAVARAAPEWILPDE